ncbi:MAG TPA: hypothetical protein VE972_11080 [Conexibacter sp.]|nr:hypothetical protein [Conexibacter sp.]
MSRPPVCGAALVLVLAALVPATAQARWSAPELVSASTSEQAQAGVVPGEVDVAADGRYVVFRTSSRNLFDDPEPLGAFRQGGIFRKDLATGALALVAPGNLVSTADPTDVEVGAADPSISADGRYVAFDTAQGLVPADANGVRDVYVRDMTLAPGAPGAYTLVSAPDGADGPLAYDPAVSGAVVDARDAIGDDGREVAFRTRDATSDAVPGGAAGGQVLVRDLDARRTTLVTVGLDGTPAGGAENAALSGDGTTVAWAGSNVAAQAPTVAGEQPNGPIVEYLWRRVADGAAATTRRVTGVGDPDDPACPPGGAISSQRGPTASPCDGPFQLGDAGGTGVPGLLALSGDGRRVAFVAGPRLRGLPTDAQSAGELFVADMRPGRSRKQALTEITRGSVVATDLARSAAIEGVGLSGDGRYLAFGTTRIAFLLTRPTLVGANVSVYLGAEQVYVADLAQRTLELLTLPFDGSPLETTGAAAAPSLSAHGETVAFGSAADRLVPGDGNSAPDAFVVHRILDASAPLPQVLPPLDPPLTFAPRPILRAQAITRRGGAIVLRILAPDRGSLRIRALLGRATLARTARATARPGDLRVTVMVARRARTRARRSRLPLRARVRLAPPGGRPLTRTIVVRRRAW